MMLYLVQRTDARQVTLAGDIDPAYLAAFRLAQQAGVEVMALGCQLSPEGIELGEALPFSASLENPAD